jgi:hypothetical protein
MLKFLCMEEHLTESVKFALAMGLAGMGLFVASCGQAKSLAELPAEKPAVVPSTPMPLTGQARVAGVVRDGGHGVAGATVKIAETDATATTDATGAYAMVVPSDSTLTFFTTAKDYAPSFRESIVLADRAMVTGFDLSVLSTADVTRINTLAAPTVAATRGLMAVRLHSLSPTCATAGAKVTVWPPLAATVIYNRPSEMGGLDEPDPTLVDVQAGAHVDAWLAGAIPPGNLLRISIDQPGCALMDAAPSVDGLQLTGLLHVDAQSSTEADFFLQ